MSENRNPYAKSAHSFESVTEPVLEVDVELFRKEFPLRFKIQTSSPSFAVKGPSGAGKSTFLRILAGLETHLNGRVVFRGEVWQDSARGVFVPTWSRRLGYVPQDSLLIPTLNVFDNLGFAGADGNDVKVLADQLEVGHLLARKPRMLSGGEKQRVALGRAILAKPRILLLDEPFSALDPELRNKVSDLVLKISTKHHISMVLVSHEASDVRSLVQETFTFRDGVLAK